MVAAVRGDHDRASVLGREHLLEFPDDALVASVLATLDECAVPHRRFPPPGTAHSTGAQV